MAVYRAALALHTRATLLAAAEAAAAHPQHPYSAFREGLEQYSGGLQAGHDDLTVFVRELADREIKLGGLVWSSTANQASALVRRLLALASELAHPVPINELPAAIGRDGSLELEGVQHSDGSVTLLAPVEDEQAP